MCRGAEDKNLLFEKNLPRHLKGKMLCSWAIFSVATRSKTGNTEDFNS